MAAETVAVELLQAHRQKATGSLKLRRGGRESVLLFKQGEVVGMEMTFGQQTVLQGLLTGQRISLGQLDALWARGEGAVSRSETLEELGTNLDESRRLQGIANVKRLAELSEGARFEPGQVDKEALVLPGVEAVRAAFEPFAAEDDEPRVYRCVDLDGAAHWILTDDELEFIEGLAEFRSNEGLPLTRRVLLEVLARDGKAESMTEKAWQRQEKDRREAEEAARVAEEKRRAEEAARLAEEKRLAEEAARLAEEKRLAEEAARLAEERRLAEEAARLAEEKRLAEEAARLVDEKRLADESARLAEERRLAEEAARLAEEKRLAEEAARAEEERKRQEEEARLAEEKRLAEEAARLAEQKRLVEEAARAEEERRRLEEEARLAEERRFAEEAARLAEEKRLAEEAARAEEERRRLEEEARLVEERRRAEEEARRLEEQRLAEEAARAEEERRRREEEARLAEEQRLAEEAARLAEEKRAAEEAARLVEEQRRAEEAARLEAERLRAEEEGRLAEQRRLAEEAARLAEEQRLAEEAARVAEEKRLAEEAARLAEEQRLAEEAARLAEERRQAEEAARRAEERRLAEEAARLEEERRRSEEELRLAEERRRAEEEARLAEERRRAQEEARLAEERRRAEEEMRLAQERQRAEEEARLAEERRRVEEEARLAEERRRAEEEMRLAEERRRAEEEARLAEERRRAAEEMRLAEERQRAEEEARLAAERARIEEEARAAEERRRVEAEALAAEERRRQEEEERIKADREALLNATFDEGWVAATPVVEAPKPLQLAQVAAPAAVADRDNLVKHREQSDLLRELNEALRRSVSSATIEEPSVVVDTEQTDTNLEMPAMAKAFRQAGLTSEPLPRTVTPVPATGSPKPLILGPQSAAADSGEGDLWKIVEPSAVEVAATTSNSFEEALQRVDSDLEALVAQATDEGVWDTPVVEATVETVIEPDSPTEEIRLSEEDLADDPSDSADAARQRRQRLLRRAMENLGAINQPSVPGSPTPIPTRNMPTPLPRTATPPPKASGAPSGGDEQLAEQIERRFETLQKNKELYAILGLPVGAPKDGVKQAFLSLAKVYHPDRLPTTLPHLAKKMSSIFESIREAYEQLYDDAKRASYMSAMASGRGPGGAAPKPAAAGGNADDLARMGEVFFKKRDYRNAEDHFTKAHALDNKANSLAARAWAIYSDPTRKAEVPSAKQMMTQALKLDANCDRAHYQLGVIARVEGDVERAEKHFRAAVGINAKHLEANQELRLIEMRKKKGTR